jgi:hypothetical protein
MLEDLILASELNFFMKIKGEYAGHVTRPIEKK